uniref:NADH-ubiquinone oxidoreductase chain 6 n=1 Tax=Solenosthedium bilunatum TaxID=2080405 RepID=A0A2P1CMP5_9HEMI|nr:NADH dehydrogenase subunit 6 [Solenosthedium bilunatum]
MMTMMYSVLITLSITFLWLKHPISMGFILILQTVTIALISGMMISNFFFSYIIIIIMLSGALVLFIYMASIASNEKFKTSINMMVVVIASMTMNLYYMNIQGKEYSSNKTLEYTSLSLSKMFNSMSSYMTIMMIIYLLLTMIVVSFIANNKEGPLRMKMYEQTHTENTPINKNY